MLHVLQAIVFLPLILLQGLWVAVRVERLPEAAGPKAGEKGQGQPLRLLMVGDSSAAGMGAETQEQALMGQLSGALSTDFRVQWRLVAKGGVTTAKAHALLLESGDTPCDVAVVCLGVNDSKNGVSARQWRESYAALLSELRARGARQIVVCGLPPIGEFPLLPWPLRPTLGARAQYFDQILRELVQADPAAVHLPSDFTMDASLMARDGFHPGPQIYAAWGEGVAQVIRQGA